MLTVRRRPRTLRDYVRAGQAQAIQPTTSSGWTRYGAGREFLLAGEPSNTLGVGSLLRYAAGTTDWQSGTVALRFVPNWAANDGVIHGLFCLSATNDTTYRLVLQKTAANVWSLYYNSGGKSVNSPNLNFAAGTLHRLIGRWSATAIDLNYDGTNATQVATGTTLTGFQSLMPGAYHSGVQQASGYVGPVVVSPTRKSDAWVTAITADSGAAFSDPARLFRDFMSVGDIIMPLGNDSVAYTKVVGFSPFDLIERVLVCEGDSLTAGNHNVVGERYPDIMAASLGTSWGVFNVGAGSQTITTMITDAAAQVDARFDNGYLSNIVVIWAGINDIVAGESAADLHAEIQTYCAARRAVGWKVVVCTVTPAANCPDAKETVRTDLNTLLRANYETYADALADIGGDADLGDWADRLNTTYYQADATHFTLAGNTKVASIIQTAIESIL
jgi:lysophospholipase L1-like esterase